MNERFPKSLPDFYRMFGAEQDCLQYMYDVRWPEGFKCPYCEGKKAYWLESRHAVECGGCGRQVSLTAGTVMEKTHTPLCTWFLGAYLQTTLKPGISALQFQRQVGLSRYETAFQMLHKLRASMVRPSREKLAGTVEVDEAYIGGHQMGKRGRGAEGKALVVGAVEVKRGKDGMYAGRARLQLIDNVTRKELHEFIEDNVERGAVVKTDGFASYEGIEDAGYKHVPIVLERPEQASEAFPHIHRVFGNLKAWLIGTHHGVSPKHIQAYLNEYVFRFNRRFSPMESFNTMLGLAAWAESPTYDELYRAGSKGGWVHPNPLRVGGGA